MDYLQVIHSIFTGLLLVSQAFTWRALQEHSNRSLKDRITEVEASQERQEQWYKKLNANYALIIARQKRHAEKTEDDQSSLDFEQSANETPEQWKRRMRSKLATGELKHK